MQRRREKETCKGDMKKETLKGDIKSTIKGDNKRRHWKETLTWYIKRRP